MPILHKDGSDSSDMDSLYSEESDEASTSDESADTAEKPEVEPHSELISSKLVMGKEVKPGDQIILEVVKSYGDEIEVKYASKEKSSEDSMSEDAELEALSV